MGATNYGKIARGYNASDVFARLCEEEIRFNGEDTYNGSLNFNSRLRKCIKAYDFLPKNKTE